ncbi:ABC transporter ATP-binding protein [Gordonia sihwensis]|uniref:ABC transporter ATP-binding protein n=1 Tax=Gordonia sihwensis TaxID=173559 RepID=UPI000A8FB06E|nr:ABC transporter ATP-binding protein [Gordonia sihwensis]
MTGPIRIYGMLMRELGRVGGRGRRQLLLALLCSVIGTLCGVLLPAALAKLTNAVFAGALGAALPADRTTEQVVAEYRAEGDTATANLIERSGAVPGHRMDWDVIDHWVGWSIVLIIVILVARSAGGLLLNSFVQDTVRGLRTELEQKIHRLPLSAVDGGRRGHVVNTTTVDVDNLATMIGPAFVAVPVIVLTCLAVIVALGLVSLFFLGVALAVIPVMIALSVFVIRRARPHMQTQWATTSSLTSHIEDVYSAREMLTVYDAYERPVREFDRLNGRLAHATRSGQTWSGTLSPAMSLCNALVFVTIAVLGALKMLDGALTLGALQAIVMYTQQLSNQVSELASNLPRIQSGIVSFTRVREFLGAADEAGPAVDDLAPSPTTGDAPPPHIRFQNVSFEYEPGRPVLRGVNLDLPPGRTLALVGATGSGKTTLTSLLQRFYDPSGGEITIDGVDIATMSRSQVRSQMAVVAQEPWLFTGTVRENIAFGSADGGMPTSPVRERLVGALPNGLDTEVSGDHESLSSGEKQFVTVARALAARPRILILDEATSSADPRSEVLIQEGVSALREHTTTIVVTHRMSTLAIADVVAVLVDGRVAEAGAVDELLAADGEFARMYR